MMPNELPPKAAVIRIVIGFGDQPRIPASKHPDDLRLLVVVSTEKNPYCAVAAFV